MHELDVSFQSQMMVFNAFLFSEKEQNSVICRAAGSDSCWLVN